MFLASTHSVRRFAALIVFVVSVAVTVVASSSAAAYTMQGADSAVVVDPGDSAGYPWLDAAYPDTLLRVSVSGADGKPLEPDVSAEPDWKASTPDPSGLKVTPDKSAFTPDPSGFVPVTISFPDWGGFPICCATVKTIYLPARFGEKSGFVPISVSFPDWGGGPNPYDVVSITIEVPIYK